MSFREQMRTKELWKDGSNVQMLCNKVSHFLSKIGLLIGGYKEIRFKKTGLMIFYLYVTATGVSIPPFAGT